MSSDVLRLARPFHPWRLRRYAAAGALTTVVFTATTVGVGTGVLEPTFTLDVIANLLLAVPILGIPVLALVNAPGEHREPLEKASELALVFIALSASSQLTYELLFVIGHPLGWWQAGGEPGWGWLWWQYAQLDSRYVSGNALMFGLECVSVVAGFFLAIAFRHLVDPARPTHDRLRLLWLAVFGCTVTLTSTLVYFATEARVGFDDIGQGALYGFCFKFGLMNLVFVVLPLLVIGALAQQIGHLERSTGAAQARAADRLTQKGQKS